MNATAKAQNDLELGIHELEDIQAPGFWQGVSIGSGVATTVAGIIGAAIIT